MEMSKDEERRNFDPAECQFLNLQVGDIVWSRIPGYPFWPGMISYDPIENIFSKRKESYKSVYTSYHVQYFGVAAQHGWTSSKNVLLFEGREKFDELVESVKKNVMNLGMIHRQQLISKYSVMPSYKKKWGIAVEEAERAFSLCHADRIEDYTFEYIMPKNKRLKGNEPKNEKEKANPVSNGSNINMELPESGKKNSVASNCRSDNICQICEKPSSDITCKGPCLQSFHADCLGIKMSSEFICDNCHSGKHICFHCKGFVGTVKKCSSTFCGKFYHMECLQLYPSADKEKFICPLHMCLSCYNDNPKNPCIYKCRFVRCIRCPTAYHSKENCIAAGCLYLGQFTVLCPSHFVPEKQKPYQSVINISWCFICGNTGELICCDSCPAAFHASCIETEPPEGKYFCEECVSRKFVRYGNIVWVKIGTFRWWPACVKNPKDVPQNIVNKKLAVGVFPIQYFGTKEYYWTHQGRVYLYSEGDICSTKENSKPESSRGSSTNAKYQASLREAEEAFTQWTQATLKEHMIKEKTPSYKFIKVSKPIGKVEIHNGDIFAHSKCLCDGLTSSCGDSSRCLNRSMLIECHPSLCTSRESCQNQIFQKRLYAKVAPFRTLNRGWALKCLENIKAGSFVIEYVGDLIDREELNRRLAIKHEDDDHNYYFLTLDKDRIIDAGPRGNLSRFMNHSCSPNCETQKWLVNGDLRVGLFAKCDIVADTELTFDYMLDSFDNEKLKCLCGAANCHGAIGAKAVKTEAKNSKTEVKKKRKRKIPLKCNDENSCFICREPGTLVMCDRKACPKAYHINCLEMKRVPIGKWHCPWHFCDECGKASKYLCRRCPNSFCKNHEEGGTNLSTPELYVCSDHKRPSTNDTITSPNGH